MTGRRRIPSVRRRTAVAVAATLSLGLVACGGSSGGEVGAGAGESAADEAGAGAGELVGSGVKRSEDGGEGDDSTTTSAEAPPASDTTAAPPQTDPPRTTAPPRTDPPPQTVFTPAPTTAARQPDVVGPGALGGDRRTVYDQVAGGLQVERGLNDSAQAWSGTMASYGTGDASSNLFAELNFPWRSVQELTGFGTSLDQVIDRLKGQTGGYSHVGVGVTVGGDGNYYVSIRLGRQ